MKLCKECGEPVDEEDDSCSCGGSIFLEIKGN